MRLIHAERGFAVEINHKQDAPTADFIVTLTMAEAKMLQDQLGAFVNTLEWLWKNEKR